MDRQRPEIACLMYHDVSDDPASTGMQRAHARRYTLDRRAFAEHLQRFTAAGLVPEAVAELGFARPGRHLLLTFDDGGKSGSYVADVLAERGWPAHFFVITSRIGGATFLNGAELRALRAGGHLVGTHSHTHPDIFRDLTRRQMLDEWRTSRTILEDLLGEPCVAGSVPGGDISAQVLEAAAEAGLRFLFTSEPWTAARRVNDCWVFGRLCLKAGMSPDRVEARVRMRGWRMDRLERGLKELARFSMAPLYRMYVERTTSPLPPESSPPTDERQPGPRRAARV